MDYRSDCGVRDELCHPLVVDMGMMTKQPGGELRQNAEFELHFRNLSTSVTHIQPSTLLSSQIPSEAGRVLSPCLSLETSREAPEAANIHSIWRR